MAGISKLKRLTLFKLLKKMIFFTFFPWAQFHSDWILNIHFTLNSLSPGQWFWNVQWPNLSHKNVKGNLLGHSGKGTLTSERLRWIRFPCGHYGVWVWSLELHPHFDHEKSQRDCKANSLKIWAEMNRTMAFGGHLWEQLRTSLNLWSSNRVRKVLLIV